MNDMQTHLQELDWHKVDATDDPGVYTAYLDRLDTAPAMQQMRRNFIDYLPCKEGEHILDSGCGSGSDSLLLAQKVGPSGKVFALDFSQRMLQHAKTRRADLSSPIDYAAGSLLCLPLAENTFDGAICNRVLMHLTNPQQAVSELVRALKPGAWLGLFEPDWSAARLEPDGIISRVLMQTHSDSFANGNIGAQLPELMSKAGCSLIQRHNKSRETRDFGQVVAMANFERSLNHLIASGQHTTDEIRQWRQQMEQASTVGTFSCHFAGVVCIGRKGNP
jgi:ubiquinone/menaquinone biosynthesis C-methylase UbiE